MTAPRSKFVPPTHKLEDCICGAMTSNYRVYARLDVVCPACDGQQILQMPTEKGDDCD